LFSSAKSKTNFSKETGKKYSWKINFCTLTIPEQNKIVDDKFSKEILLWEFLDSCRSSEGLKNYVWKVEPQNNGYPHFHITTDSFLDKNKINNKWNKILDKYNLLDSYKSLYNNSNAPSTQVKAVKNIKNLQAYICEYLAKEDSFKSYCSLSVNYAEKDRYIDNFKWIQGNYVKCIVDESKKIISHKVNSDGLLLKIEFDRNITDSEKWMFVEFKSGIFWEKKRNIKGRIWGSNYSLSKANKLTKEFYINNNDELDNFFNSSYVRKVKCIVGKSSISEGRDIGEIVFMNDKSWNNAPHKLREVYHNERMKIQQISKVKPK